MYKWKAEYELGIEKFDNEHKMLFELAHRGYNLLTNDFRLYKSDLVIDAITELKFSLRFHFDNEERYMAGRGYRRGFSHMLEHQQLMRKIESLDLSRISSSQGKYAEEILDCIITSVKEHILEQDKEYAKAI